MNDRGSAEDHHSGEYSFAVNPCLRSPCYLLQKLIPVSITLCRLAGRRWKSSIANPACAATFAAMTAVRAIYEKGVFRPLEPVDLPEACEVLVTPATARAMRPAEPGEMDEIYAILGRRHRSGEHDVAERHNEHQP